MKRAIVRSVIVLAALAVAGCFATQPPRHQQSTAQQQVSRPQPAPAPRPALGGGYRLGPGDVLQISVYNNPDLTTNTPIGEDGKISFPLIGEVVLGGLTRTEAEHRIAQRLDSGGFVPKPSVTIAITDYRSQTVSVLGEVNKPGTYPIERPLKVTRLLAMAGGINAKGSTVVTVVTQAPDGTSHRQRIDLGRIMENGNLGQDVLVGNGGIVYVPPAPVFYIYGEVRNPGAYPLTDGMTVQQALSVGGGLTRRATERGIELDRKGSDGRTHRYAARLNTPLEPDDVLRIPESWF